MRVWFVTSYKQLSPTSQMVFGSVIRTFVCVCSLSVPGGNFCSGKLLFPKLFSVRWDNFEGQ